jgi:two-component system CheB/CheR fusion protein
VTRVQDEVTGKPAGPPSFHVVGIGASAGGLEALESFFDNISNATDMAFVVVQHLSPDFKSLMDELLARHTELPIHPVEDAMVVEPGHVYLIPPRKEMIISGGKLLLSDRTRTQELTLPIDVFFRSLAQDCGPRAVAIVLSGGGSDGSRGIRAVHEAGGLVIVQDVESAQFDGMPKTARDAGVAKWVLSPAEMPRILAEHVRQPRAPRLATAAVGLPAVYSMLEAEFGIDFTHYKPSTVTRRIERRLELARATDMDDYVARLRSGRSELDVLYRDLLIGVTRFFRNEEAFRILEERVVPEIFGRLAPEAPLRAWVAGCATGEEAYSMAIVLHEVAQRFGGRPFKLFATDVHKGSLEIAGRALYGQEAVAHVSPERLERYFTKVGSGWQLVPEIRQMVVFAPHNVIRDAPFTRVDLISCRNMLIYLQEPAQQKALSLFHFALNRGGVLFLGPSESPGALLHDFATIDRHWRMYRKFTDVRIPVEGRLQTARSMDGRLGQQIQLPPAATRVSAAHLVGTYDALLDEYMPPSLLVTERGELVHTFNGASRFLSHRDGRPGLSGLDAVGEDLKLVLVGGLKRASSEPAGVLFKRVQLELSGGSAAFDIMIKRVGGRGRGVTHLLITFAELEKSVEGGPVSVREVPLDEVSRERIEAVQAELTYTKENLQAAIEELETSNEELQAANEELLASNEELQSTNEELQSVNEELYTVNAEYQRKIAELTELTNDMDNLLSATDIGTIFLDENLHIRKFTPQIAHGFNLLPRDVGRPIETFSHNLEHSSLLTDLRRVLETGTAIERETKDRHGRALFLRVLPYRAKGAAAGVVLTLIDVTGLKAAEDALFHERYLLNGLLATVPDAIYFKDAKGRFIRVNPVMAKRLGVDDPRMAVGKLPADLPKGASALALIHHDEAVVRTGSPQLDCLERRVDDTGQEAWDLSTRLPLMDRDQVVGVIAIVRDVTQRQQAEARIKEEVRRRDQFLAMLSHELRNPLGAIVMANGVLGAEHDNRDERLRVMKLLDRQSAQMSRLLDDLLEASRVTQNKIELRRAAVDLTAVARDASEAVRQSMVEKGLTFSCELAPGPLWVTGDATRLHQIVANLLSNAAKYTAWGGHVSLRLAGEAGVAVLAVRDDGVGLAPEMLTAVFDLFVQARRTLDRADGGLGVGLTLVRSLVELHGGTVSAASEGEGKGSEFVMRLPLAAAPATDVSYTPPTARRVDGARVVIVEDNPDAAEMACHILTRAGYQCESASDGVTGLELIAELRPDIALVDLGLPGMNGFEVARAVRAAPETAETYLVAMTGYGQSSDRLAAFEAGFDEHLAKPVHPDRLLALLAAVRKSGAGTVSRVDGPTSAGRRAGHQSN